MSMQSAFSNTDFSTKELHQLQIAFKAEELKRSYYKYLLHFWSVIEPARKLQDNWTIKYLCDLYQRIVERAMNGLPTEYDWYIINIPPGETKSTIFTKAPIGWCWAKQPAFRMLHSTHNSRLSLKQALKARDIVKSSQYQQLFPYVKIRGDQDNKGMFMNDKTGLREAASVGGGITGTHVHVITVDDPIDKGDIHSTIKRQEANTYCDETLSTRVIDENIVPKILIMQRLHDDDPSGHLLRKAKKEGLRVFHVCLPAELTKGAKVVPESLKSFYRIDEEAVLHPHPKIRGKAKIKLLNPLRKSRKILEKKIIELGADGYAAEMQQSPSKEGGNVWLEYYFKGRFREDMLPVTVSKNILIDGAFTENENNDPTGFLVYGVHKGRIKIFYYEKVWMKSPDLRRYLPKLARKVGYNAFSGFVGVEPKANGIPFIQDYNDDDTREKLGLPEMNVRAWQQYYTIEDGDRNYIKVNFLSMNKRQKAELVNAKLSSGIVDLLEGAEWIEEFMNDCTKFPRAANDEIIDLLACAVMEEYDKTRDYISGYAGIDYNDFIDTPVALIGEPEVKSEEKNDKVWVDKETGEEWIIIG